MLKATRLLVKAFIVLTYLSFGQSWGADFWATLWQPDSKSLPSISSSSRPLLTSNNSIQLEPVYQKFSRPLTEDQSIVQTAALGTEKSGVSKTTHEKIGTLKIPRPPRYLPLSEAQTQNLTDKAKAGDKTALKTLLQRIHWHASKNPLSIEDVLKIKDINKKALSSRGYLYWSLLVRCEGLEKIPGLAEKIKVYATSYHLATAQYAMGLISDKSWGWEKESAKWYQLSANQGYAPAQYKIGCMYEGGLGGLEKNEQRAREFYQLAVDQGYLEGMFTLGLRLRIEDQIDHNLCFSLLFNSSWADVCDKRFSNRQAYRYIKDNINYKKTLCNVSLLFDKEIYFQKILSLCSKLTTELSGSRSQGLFESSGLISNTALKIEDCIRAIPGMIDDLRKIELGFLVNCIYLPCGFFNRHPDMKNYLSSVYLDRYPNESYVIIGTENSKIYEKVRHLLDNVTKIVEPSSVIYSKQGKIYQEKLMKLTDQKKALNTLKALDTAMPSEEYGLIPRQLTKINLKIRTYEMMISDQTLLFEENQKWNKTLKDIEAAFETFIREGVHQRNKDFLEVYNYIEMYKRS